MRPFVLLGLLYFYSAVVDGQSLDEEPLLNMDEDDDVPQNMAPIEGSVNKDLKDPFDESSIVYTSLVYKPLQHDYSKSLLVDEFQHSSFETSSWIRPDDPTYKGEWKYVETDKNYVGNRQLVMSAPSSYYGAAHNLKSSWSPQTAESLYVSMEVKYPESHTCGGAYIKLFDSSKNPISSFTSRTPYSIMFGPDHCGTATNKVHLILQKTVPGDANRVEFAMAKTATLPYDKSVTHHYGLVLRSDNTYQIWLDGAVSHEGPLAEGCEKCFEAPLEIFDPDDVEPEGWTPPPQFLVNETAVKPDDWDETQPEEVADLEAPMPEGWEENEPLMIPNPDAHKPEDWDDAEDGEWVVPQMKNPKCSVGCGKWSPMKANPLYKGKWEPPTYPNPDYTPTYPRRKIPNPHMFNYTEHPYDIIESFDAVGFELWAVEADTAFDNLLVTTDKNEFFNLIEETWRPKSKLEEENRSKYIEAKRAHAQLKQESAAAGAGSEGVVRLLSRSRGLLFTAVPILSLAYLILRKRGYTFGGASATPTTTTASEESTADVVTGKKDDSPSDKTSEKTVAETEGVDDKKPTIAAETEATQRK